MSSTPNSPQWKFLIASALLVGSFAGNVYYHRKAAQTSKMMQADQILSTGTSSAAELAKATDLISEVLVEQPGNPKALMIKALSLQKRGLIDDALKNYEELTSASASLLSYGHFNAAVLYQITGQDTKAEAHYWQSLQGTDIVPMFYSNLIKLLLKNQRIDEAKQLLQDAQGRWPKAPEVLEVQALIASKG
jgi:Tfp pilus assembly protein PilF